MNVENGIVSEEKNGMVLVDSEPGTGCSSCHAKGSCMMGAEGKTRSIWIKNSLDAHIGDVLSFSIEEKAVVLASVILYLIPVVFLITGAVLGANIHEKLNMETDLASGFGGLSGLIISFFIIKIITSKFKNRKLFLPVLKEVIKRGLP